MIMMTDAGPWELQMVQPDMSGRHQYRLGPRNAPGGVTIRCTRQDAKNLLAAINIALAAAAAPAPPLPLPLPPCTCGYGGFHEPENPLCERNTRDQ